MSVKQENVYNRASSLSVTVTSSSLKAGSKFGLVWFGFSLTPKGNVPNIPEGTNYKHWKEKLSKLMILSKCSGSGKFQPI